MSRIMRELYAEALAERERARRDATQRDAHAAGTHPEPSSNPSAGTSIGWWLDHYERAKRQAMGDRRTESAPA